MKNKRAILKLAVSTGEVLLQNGAEIFRVQETIARILEAFGIRDYHLYVLSNGIFATLDEETEENLSAVRHITVSAINLSRIAAVNELSRDIVQNPDEALLDGYRARLQKCAESPPFPLWMRMLACGAGSGSFCFLLGGGALESLAAFACGFALQIFLALYGKNKQSRFMHTILGAFLVSSLSVGVAGLFPVLSLDHIIIGSIISLVPGVALTTAIRDFFNGDFLSGNIHLTDALLIAVCIVVGVGVALQFWPHAAGRVLL